MMPLSFTPSGKRNHWLRESLVGGRRCTADCGGDQPALPLPGVGSAILSYLLNFYGPFCSLIG